MEPEGRRVRRFGSEREFRTNHSLLPLRSRTTPPPSLSNSISFSCWYCDYKISTLNQPLFHLGRRYAAIFRPWFSVGVGFALTALLSVSLILLWEIGRALRVLPECSFGDLSSSLLFGFSSFPSSKGISLADAGYLLVSTLISVSLHEFGHALAGASEGIQMDYIAIFIVVLFPGALVAFNYDLLQALPRFASLRIYCAGIWHNAVCCAVCGLVLFFLPMILFPFYQHGESPMVLAIPSSSPLTGHLSPGDIIVSLDGIRINSAQEWMGISSLLNQLALENMNNATSVESIRRVNSSKGYCVPDSVLEENKKIKVVENQFGCPDDLAPFVAIPCPDTRLLDGNPKRVEENHCLNAKEVVKFNKCGDGWMGAETEGGSCACSQDKSCLSPIQTPDMLWVEVSYSSPYSSECLQFGRKLPSASRTSDFVEPNCGGTFVFVGDIISMASAIRLTAYQPRWAYFSPYLPDVLERIFMCTFHVSLTLALLNSLPVYFLDGESLLDAALCHFTMLSPNKRGKVLRICCLAGTLTCLLTLFRIFLKFL
ncbi:membrane-bound transcription factor site-2 protease homolog [Morus notabilis]|uniref:membrane-bound transcription factor site-2 protease homolog n=1 Tax=Morus notabilis TaxID=981085 RepID=UPI000CECE8D5|nr:membrane-bound transcription factor site-2 protease homolog [Morus notabilis]